jgi:outer membrane lipoprotein
MALALLLAGCASSPVSTDGVEVAPIGPAHVLAGEAHEGQRVVWGGRIIGLNNFADYTEIAVVSYPLDRADRPRLGSEPGVRFLITQTGFLEPFQYAAGRYVTVLGQVEGVVEQRVGEYIYDHPLIQAQQIHLWPLNTAEWQTGPRFSIGVGVRL